MVTRKAGRVGGLSRRELLALGGSTAAAAVLSACTPTTSVPSGTGAPAGQPRVSTTPGPRQGGTLTWSYVTEIPAIDPAVTVGAGDDLIGNMFDSLVSVDAEGNVHPWLAAKWTVENDSKRFTFTLRDDVKFHDGTPLDSTAVKRTLERVADPRTKGAQAAAFLGPLDHAETPDPRTVVLVFKDPTPLLLLNLWRQRLGIISSKQLDALKPGDVITDAPVGSGPYKWVGRAADGVITMARNTDYKWGPEFKRNRGAPYLDAIKIRRIAEASTRTATLESGESLLVDDLSDVDFARLKGDKRFAFVQVPRKGPGYGFLFNTKKGPAADLAVRQAVNWAVDRQAIVDKVLFGVHHPLVGPMTEGMWGRLDEIEKTIPYSGDKKKAADILEAGGWKMGASGIREKGGEKLSMLLAQNAGVYPSNDLGAALQLQVKEIGIDLRLQQMPSSNWLDFVRSYKHDMCDTRGTNFDPDELRGRFGSSGIGTLNYTNLTDPQLDDLLAKGQLAPVGSDARRQIYASVQRRMMELLPLVALITPIRTYAMTARLHDLQGDVTGANAFPMTDPWLES